MAARNLREPGGAGQFADIKMVSCVLGVFVLLFYFFFQLICFKFFIAVQTEQRAFFREPFYQINAGLLNLAAPY